MLIEASQSASAGPGQLAGSSPFGLQYRRRDSDHCLGGDVVLRCWSQRGDGPSPVVSTHISVVVVEIEQDCVHMRAAYCHGFLNKLILVVGSNSALADLHKPSPVRKGGLRSVGCLPDFHNPILEERLVVQSFESQMRTATERLFAFAEVLPED